MTERGALRRSWRILASAAIAVAALGVFTPSPAAATATGNAPAPVSKHVVASAVGCSDPSPTQAVLFADANYGGACVTLGSGEYPLVYDFAPVGNDDAESVKVGARASIILCTDGYYEGTCATLTADVPDLAATAVGANIVSSALVTVATCSPGSGEVTLFADAGYGGACVTLLVGVYNWAASHFGRVGNDNAESVKVGGGVALTLCQDTSLTGVCATIASDVPDLAATAVGRNAATSGKVAGLTCVPGGGEISIYADADYGGACVTLSSGSYEWALVDFGAVGNDNAESVKSGGDVVLSLCADGSYEGGCATIDGDVPDLDATTVGRNAASSAIVSVGCVPAPGQVSIFADIDYGGACITLNPGSYPWALDDFGDVGNDNAESVKVGADATATLCGDIELGGACATIVSDTPDLATTSLAPNSASSARVQVPWPDQTPPSTGWDAPTNGYVFSSPTVTLTAHAADAGGSGLARVEFWGWWGYGWTQVGQAALAGASGSGSYVWDTCASGAAGDSYLFALVAFDTAGNSVRSGQISISRTYNCAATRFDVSSEASWAAGAGNAVTVTARDGSGSVATGYRGTVHFTSTDTKAVLSADYTFTATDVGVRTFTFGDSFVLKTAGTQAIRARDTVNSTVTGLRSGIVVTPGPAASLRVAAAASWVAGTTQNITVTALDAYGNTAPSYTGTVHFTSTDSTAALAPDHAFASGDAGVHEFPAVLKKAGTQAIRARDTATATITGLKSGMVVAPSVAATLRVVTVASTVAGTAKSVTVTALDAYGNTATGYRGRIHFTSTDTKAALPADYTFVAADAGVHSLTLTLKTAGAQAVRARDTVTATITGLKSGIVVSPAAAATLKVTAPSPWAAGSAQTVTVSALDAYGNTATGYLGTVHFTSTDAQAVLPANHAFAAGDHGVHTFSVTLKTAGAQAIRARDTVTATITGVRTNIVVS